MAVERRRGLKPRRRCIGLFKAPPQYFKHFFTKNGFYTEGVSFLQTIVARGFAPSFLLSSANKFAGTGANKFAITNQA